MDGMITQYCAALVAKLALITGLLIYGTPHSTCRIIAKYLT